MVRNYYFENKAHLSLWEPARDYEFHTLEKWQEFISEYEDSFNSGTAVKFIALNKTKTEIIGVCNFSNIVHGVFQACNVGYSVAKKYESQGYMYEILSAAIKYIFEFVGMHRVMANYIPENDRSAAVLNRLGFEKEGYAKSYLKINGKWQDHILTSKINPGTGT